MSESDLCAYVWWFLTHDADPDEVRKFEVRLWRPDPKTMKVAAKDPEKLKQIIPDDSPWSAKSENAALAAFAAQVGVATPGQGGKVKGVPESSDAPSARFDPVTRTRMG